MNLIFGAPDLRVDSVFLVDSGFNRLRCAVRFVVMGMSNHVRNQWDDCVDKMGDTVLGSRGKFLGFRASDEGSMDAYVKSVYGSAARVKHEPRYRIDIMFELHVPGLGTVFFYVNEHSKQIYSKSLRGSYMNYEVECSWV